ncbi:MAG: LysR family transcriptional regulator [Eubacteriales bacterium]|nr:LysR family transcriptional regulator [Eubacteriales bacterium]
MDTEKCRALLAAVEAGTMADAAKHLGYTTSGISRAIASLEEELGLTLLYRGRSGICLTPDGEQLLPAIRSFLRQGEILEETAKSLQGLEFGQLRIGVSHVSYYRQIANVVEAFRRQYPGVEVSIIQGNSSHLRDEMLAHRLDLFIGSEREGDFTFTLSGEDEMCVCVAADHPAANEEIYDLRNLKDEKLIMPYADTETNARMLLTQLGIQPLAQYTTTDIYSAYSMAEAGLGVTFLNRIEAESWTGNVKLLKTHPVYTIRTGLMYQEKTLSLTGRRFLQLRESFPDDTGELDELLDKTLKVMAATEEEIRKRMGQA